MKKLSKYTIFHKDGNKTYIFHQMSNAFLDIDSELEEALKNGFIENLPDDILTCLEKNGFIVNEATDESCNIRYANIKNRYNSKLLRATILPTLNCNFKCWYCYEQHKISALTESNAMSVMKFIKNEARVKHIEVILLDWFGGEPLLRFNQTIYPMSKELKAWCEANDIKYKSSITTNGSLINEKMAEKMEEIKLNQFQITLDGDMEHHNRTKSSPSIKDSYNVTIKNIHSLCHKIKKPNIELRINYTSENIDSAFNIFNDFDKDIRKYITISPHIVWQVSNKSKELFEKVDALRKEAINKGFNISTMNLSHLCSTCYIENMEQFVINYDMNVYKCTARDFGSKYSIGKINREGTFEPNDLYYKYYTTETPFMRKECLECEFLPSCLYSTSCLQKEIENVHPKCNKDSISLSLHKEINRKLQQLTTT